MDRGPLAGVTIDRGALLKRVPGRLDEKGTVTAAKVPTDVETTEGSVIEGP